MQAQSFLPVWYKVDKNHKLRFIKKKEFESLKNFNDMVNESKMKDYYAAFVLNKKVEPVHKDNYDKTLKQAPVDTYVARIFHRRPDNCYRWYKREGEKWVSKKTPEQTKSLLDEFKTILDDTRSISYGMKHVFIHSNNTIHGTNEPDDLKASKANPEFKYYIRLLKATPRHFKAKIHEENGDERKPQQKRSRRRNNKKGGKKEGEQGKDEPKAQQSKLPLKVNSLFYRSYY